MPGTRVFRVFVSSTFEDFQAEREMLRSRVWPELERLCALRGASFEAIDLRWGIPANGAEDLDIISICLGEVERCRELSPRPNFLALVGNRYGWRPLPLNVPRSLADSLPEGARSLVREHYSLDENAVPPAYVLDRASAPAPEDESALLARIRAALAGEPMTKEVEEAFFESATHLEMERGIFTASGVDAEDHYLVCFRDIAELSGRVDPSALPPQAAKYYDRTPEGGYDAEAGEWLGRMRRGLEGRAAGADRVKRYATSLDELAGGAGSPYLAAACRDIELWLRERLLEELDALEGVGALEAERLEQRKFLESRAGAFGGRERLLAGIGELLSGDSGPRAVLVQGQGGSGKSAFMARAASEAMTRLPEASIAYRFIGATPGSVDLGGLLAGLTAELRGEAAIGGAGPGTEGGDLETRVEAFKAELGSRARRRTILFVDALDQLGEAENARSLYWLPRDLGEGYTLVLSALTGPLSATLRSLYPDAPLVDLSAEDSLARGDEAGAMLAAMLSRDPPRRLTREQEAYVLGRFEAAPFPLYLKLAAESARRWRSFDSVESIARGPRALRRGIGEQIAALAEDLASEDRYGPVFVRRALAMIALSREGASSREIAEALWLDGPYRAEFDRRKHARQPEVDSLPPIIWSRFFYEIESFLMERASGGTLVLAFFHRVFGEAISSMLSPEETREVHALLARGFSQGRHISVRLTSPDGATSYDERALTELPYHLAEAGDRVRLAATLSDLAFLDAKVRCGRAYELGEDFRLAEELESGSEPSALALLARAYRSELHFIARHPGSLFQAMYNACRWQDHPDAAAQYEGRVERASAVGLYRLMEDWASVNAVLDPGFAWLRSLRPPATRLDGPQVASVSGLPSPVSFVAFSADGKKLGAVCNGGEFVLADAESRKIEKLLRLSEEKSFIFKPDSKTRFGPGVEVASASGGSLADHPGFEYWAWPGIASGDGSLALCGSMGGVATLFRYGEAGSEARTLDPRPIPGFDSSLGRDPVRALALSADLGHCAVGYADGALVAWDLATGEAEGFFRHRGGWVNGAALSSDGGTLVSGGGDGLVYAWKRDRATRSYAGSILSGHTDRVWATAVSPDGRLAASGSDDKTVRVWDLEAGRELRCLRGHARWVQALAFGRGGSLLASSGGDGKILVWDLAGGDGPPAWEFSGHDDSVLSLAFSPDGLLLASASRDRSIRLWDLGAGEPQARLAGHRDRITCIAFSADGLSLATGANDSTLRAWDAATGRPRGEELRLGAPASALALSADGAVAWAGCANGDVEVRDLRASSLLGRLPGRGRRIYAIALSGDSRLAVSADELGRIALWDARFLELSAEIELAGAAPLSAALSPDGSRIAVGLRSGEVALLEIGRGALGRPSLAEVARRAAADAWIDGLAFSPDGSLLEARGGSWRSRGVSTLDAASLLPAGAGRRRDGAVGAFGGYELGFSPGELSVSRGGTPVAFLPKSLEFAATHPSGRQWAGVQRYNLYHFRLEGEGKRA